MDLANFIFLLPETSGFRPVRRGASDNHSAAPRCSAASKAADRSFNLRYSDEMSLWSDELQTSAGPGANRQLCMWA
jgi:hypothetical protein